ncbi:MAG: ATP synthase F1 subunit delta [Sphingobacteriia bacterium]|nr:ATP synthase F1 subunit delta [Sphingobacteriia bacterium]
MRNTIIAQRYAKALMDLSVERNQLEAVVKDIEFLSASNTAEFDAVMLSPVYSDNQKMKVFTSVFNGKLSDLTFSFFRLVFKKGRELSLREISEAFIQMYRNAKGIKLVELTTAVDVDADVKDKLAVKLQSLKQLQGKQIELQTKTDSSILGGFVAKFDDLMYDASIRRELQVIGKQFVENMYVHKMR